MLAHVPSFGRNPRGSPDFLAYPVPKACMHVLGTGIPRCFGVARSASSPKAAQALGCSLTPGLRISFGRVTCMARAASVPGLWTLGFLLLRGACGWVWVVVGFGFRLRPATPSWGVGVCVRLCVRSACTLPLLAGVCGVGVCGWVRVLAAPRHSWPGCRGLCLLVCALRLHPPTPGWGVRRGCVCFGSGFGCAPTLLARVYGCVCARVRPPLAPDHFWHGSAVWVCMFWFGFWLRPAIPGWGVGVCVFVCVLCLHPATPGTGARCGCVCLGSGFGCTPPLLAEVLGCVCACVCAPLAPSHSWHGCTVWVCVFGLWFWLRPATPGWGVGLCACSACTQPLLARVRGVGVRVWARVSAAPRHSWLGCWAVCVLRLHPATPGTGARCGCVCSSSGFGCAPPLLAGVLGCVCALLAPSHSWHGCAVWVCVFGLGFRLRPATPGWGVGLCACSACTQPLLAPLPGVGVCVWARVSAAPRHSWLGCWAVCVLRLHPATPGTGARCACVCLGSGFGCAPPLLAGVLGCVRAPPAPSHSWHRWAVWMCVFGLGVRLRPATPGWGVGLCACSACTQPLLARVRSVGVCVRARVSAALRHFRLWCWAVCVLVCALRLHPATPGTGARCGCVCLGSGFSCAPPLLAGVLGCVCALLAPSHSWHGCEVWVFVFGLGFRLRPSTPGLGVGLCVCSCARSACTQPLMARVRDVGVCVWARVLSAPRHSWLGCWVVCVLRLHPATPGIGAQFGCVCLGSGFGCAPPLLAGVLGCVRAPYAPSHSWHGCAVWVCVFGLGFRLRPATRGWGVGLCACSACTQPLLALVRGERVCVRARVSAATRHSWLGCWAVCVLCLHPATPGTAARCGSACLGLGFGCAPPLLAGVYGCVCARVRAPLAPSHSWHGCAVWVCVFGFGFCLRPATPGWGVGLCVCSACTQPLLASVRSVVVCVWARVSAAPRHSWLGCWAVCVLCLHPATSGTGARCGCVCLGSGSRCALPLVAGVLGCLCASLAPSHS